MSTALSHLPADWPNPGPDISEAITGSDSQTDAEMLESAWEWARLDGLLGEMDLFGEDGLKGADFEGASEV